MRKPMGRNKDREITNQVRLQAKQPHSGDISFTVIKYKYLINESYIGKETKEEKNPSLSCLLQPYFRPLSLSFPGLNSLCYHCGLCTAPWVMARG